MHPTCKLDFQGKVGLWHHIEWLLRLLEKGHIGHFTSIPDTYIWFALKFQTVLDITTNAGENRGPSLSHKSQCVIVFGDTRSTVGAVSGRPV